MVPGHYTAFSNHKKIGNNFLHRELEQKDEKVKHMWLEVYAAKDQKQYEFPA